MVDHDEALPQTQAAPTAAKRLSRATTSRSEHSYGGYETAESSTAASTRPHSAYLGGSTPQPDDDAEDVDRTSRSQQNGGMRKHDDVATRRTSHRPRPSGGFLLPSTASNQPPARSTTPARDEARRRSRIPVVEGTQKGKSPMNTPNKTTESARLGIDARDMVSGAAMSIDSGERRASDGRPVPASRIPSPRVASPALDVDSTQIVNMALNLSESRRLAQRRNVSTPVPSQSIPPRLAPLADASAGGSLKQHLQQQRRTSRNISPKPEQGGFGSRQVSISSPIISSPLQGSFDSETSYTYHFSSSTLNRAQKAKEHIELMTQYRRLLQILPPLKPVAFGLNRPATSSPPTSPTSSNTIVNPFNNFPTPFGRPYNPLQYIRNRKVRARERKPIDGEAQGFSDIAKVTDWIDQAATQVAASTGNPDAALVPFFAGAHGPNAQPSVVSNIPVPITNSSKAKRPRIDWVFEPADMLADTYWVEQEDNKSLIEDRHYARVLKRRTVPLPRPMSQQAEESTLSPMGLSANRQDVETGEISGDSKGLDSNTVSRTETEVPHTIHLSARERARQKLHELRGMGGMQGRHGSVGHVHHDFLRPLRKASFSDTSDSESDRRGRDRRTTISMPGKALLEKQINQMIAEEALEEQQQSVDESNSDFPKVPQSPVMATPDGALEAAGRRHSRTSSRADDSDAAEVVNRLMKPTSPMHSGRASLEVPGPHPRSSLEIDSSLPASPELRAARDSYHMLPIGADLTPPGSRQSSPSRNPLSKVKNMFRDRSRDRKDKAERGDRERDRVHDSPSAADKEKSDKPESPPESGEQSTLSPITAEGLNTIQRRRSRSTLGQKGPPRAPYENHKPHRSMGSIRLGRDDQIGLKSIFKSGAKIDSVIRGGVSKVSDFLFQKDKEAGDGVDSSASSDDDSEAQDQPRGRVRTPLIASRSGSRRPREEAQTKNYLEMMPAFKHVSEVEESPKSPGQSSPPNDDVLTIPAGSRPPSRRSSRFDKLKPPRIDVLTASPTPSPADTSKIRFKGDSEVSDSESQSRSRRSETDGVESARRTSSQLNAILSMPPPVSRPHRNSLGKKGRHWSISDRSPSSSVRTTQLSKAEVARLRALLLSTGIKAMEIARRASEPHPLSDLDSKTVGVSWDDLSHFASPSQATRTVCQTEVFSVTAGLLESSVIGSSAKLKQQTDVFVQQDVRKMVARVDALHARVASDLIEQTRRAADDADECSRDLLDGQRLKVKRVVDTIEKMMRSRRRRFRWIRRAGWLAVEWVLVGFMWYVWLLVMIARVFLGIWNGIVGFARWLFWL